MTHESNTIKGEEARVGEAAAILERALKQPGVKEMMSVYGRWESIEAAMQPYSRATAPKMVLALADTSDSTVLNPA
ncbi:MAG: hypothetical protein A2Y77_01690 [Planctomycetes bacterium RBG_13_62_9]|nr:MAG: hypothetical protein A2Y77_01690 [Planctomycetes bacterium RBG_13_62_9]